MCICRMSWKKPKSVLKRSQLLESIWLSGTSSGLGPVPTEVKTHQFLLWAWNSLPHLMRVGVTLLNDRQVMDTTREPLTEQEPTDGQSCITGSVQLLCFLLINCFLLFWRKFYLKWTFFQISGGRVRKKQQHHISTGVWRISHLHRGLAAHISCFIIELCLWKRGASHARIPGCSSSEKVQDKVLCT